MDSGIPGGSEKLSAVSLDPLVPKGETAGPKEKSFSSEMI